MKEEQKGGLSNTGIQQRTSLCHQGATAQWIVIKPKEDQESPLMTWHRVSQCIFLCCLNRSTLNLALLPCADHPASFSSLDSAPKTDILVQNEVPQDPWPVFMVW
jgi:hypothetical protein